MKNAILIFCLSLFSMGCATHRPAGNTEHGSEASPPDALLIRMVHDWWRYERNRNAEHMERIYEGRSGRAWKEEHPAVKAYFQSRLREATEHINRTENLSIPLDPFNPLRSKGKALYRAPEREKEGINIRGFVARSDLHCGGMMREPLKEPPPLRPAIVTYQVFEGERYSNTSYVVQFTSGSNGRFELSLPEGVYCVRNIHRSAGRGYGPGAEGCVKAFKQRCDYVWKITNKMQEMTLGDGKTCFGPCYNGPPPP